MYKDVKIGDKTVPMLAMASANIYYRHTFGKDAIVVQADATTVGQRLAFYSEMGYIMAMMAEAKGDRGKMMSLNEDSYVEWLDQFEAFDYTAALADIASVYEKQKLTTSKEKKAHA